MARMQVHRVREGLWRWTAPHPDWTPEKAVTPEHPGGWDEMVGCVYYEAPEAVVLIDPLAPPEGTRDAERFWHALDRDVERLGRQVAVLLSSNWHDRSTQAVVERYGARPEGVRVWAHAAARETVRCAVTDWIDGATAPDALPRGVQAYALTLPDPDEVAYFLPEHGALVCGDSIVGAGGGALRVTPAWWCPKDAATQARYHTEYRERLRKLLDLPIQIVLTSHGEPALTNGHAALEQALQAPAWGSD